MTVVMGVSEICNAFKFTCVGSRVRGETIGQRTEVRRLLVEAIDKFEFSESGQGTIPCPALIDFMETGDVERAEVPICDLIVREHRGEAIMCARRQLGVKPTTVLAIVYTREAYLADPELSSYERITVEESDWTHVLVALLASRGPRPALTSHRLVRNLAGGNNAFVLNDHDGEPAELRLERALKFAAFVREQAEQSAAYERDWIVVAD